MPQEIFDPEEFLEIATRATECRVKRRGNIVKLKLKTKKKLYTLKSSPEEANVILQRIKLPIIDL